MKAVLTISVIIFMTAILYFRFGWFKFFYHDVMAWHLPIEKQGFNGCSFTSICKHCGKDIMQDSQGGWF